MLDSKAKAMGAVADGIRQTIANAKEDLPEPEGKTNARMAIREIREKLSALKHRRPQASSSDLYLEEAPI